MIMEKIKTFIQKNIEILLIGLLLLISTIAHGYNMFGYPYFENDEGTYMSQAWSLIEKGELAPYTYWYDHAPLGWILIAIWVQLTGGVFTFGTSVDSGRVLMLILHVISSGLLYAVTKKISGSKFAAVIATLLFSLSPLGIYFQRRVLLDNIMVFWMLLSLFFLTKIKPKLLTIILATLFLAFAILTKENAVFFIPAYIYVIATSFKKERRVFAFQLFFVVLGTFVVLYFLYAILKGEFFPVGFFDDVGERVSLITTLKEQLSRGESMPFWDRRSDFFVNYNEWIKKDFYTIILGTITSIYVVFYSLFNKRARILALLLVGFWLFLLRGKLIIDFYVIPLIPLLAMSVGYTFNQLIRNVSFNNERIRYFLSICILFLISGMFYFAKTDHFTNNETHPQREAIEWIKKNISPDSFIAIDASIFVDLRESRFAGDPIFPYAHWAWKVEKDLEVSEKILAHDWKNIDYITITHEVLKQMREDNFPTTEKALLNAREVVSWKEGTTSYISMQNQLSTNGDWFAIYKARSPIEMVLYSSWKYYKEHFIVSYGQVIDPQTDTTNSEAQAYALLRAVYMDDKPTFDGVWQWTKDHLQHRREDSLLSWQWGKKDGKEQVLDSASAADADLDIALALILAHKKWGKEEYKNEASELISNIWKKEVVRVSGRYYLTSGSNSARPNGYLLNPSYISPAHYKLFSEYDKNPWETLVNDSYLFLEELAFTTQSPLVPNWVMIDSFSGEIFQANAYVENPYNYDYGFDAFRIYFRVGLDEMWNNDKRAKDFLKASQNFYSEEIAKGRIYAIYSLNGIPQVSYDSLSTTMAGIFVLTNIDRNMADLLYNRELGRVFNFDKGYWKDGKNYYDQNWAWFGTAYFSGSLTRPEIH